MSGLLAPCLRIEIDPHNVASFWDIRRCHYHTSLPTGPPKSTSSWRLAGVILFTSSAKSYSFRRKGSMTTRPDSSRTSTGSSSCKCAACMMAAGIRTEALFPHFLTTAFMCIPRVFTMSIHYTTALELYQHCRYSSLGSACGRKATPRIIARAGCSAPRRCRPSLCRLCRRRAGR